MRKIIVLLICIVFSLALGAQTTQYTTANLNLRTAPNSESSVIVVLPIGTPIYGDCDCEWLPIKYNGRIGYISTKYLTKQAPIRTNKITKNNSSSNRNIRYYTNSKGERVQSPTYYDKAPAGATALCRDGTYSFSRNRRGTCSRHGGVARWL